MNVIKPAIISEHFQEYQSPIRTFGKKRHGLHVHRFYHAAFAPKRWNRTKTALVLRYGDCRFLPNANCGKKIFKLGAKRVGQSVSGTKTFFFGLMPYGNNKGADQPAHLHSLISAFVVCSLDRLIPLVSISEISGLYLASVAEQAGLSLNLDANPKDRFTRDEAHF